MCFMVCVISWQEEAGWFQAQGCGEGLKSLTADGLSMKPAPHFHNSKF